MSRIYLCHSHIICVISVIINMNITVKPCTTLKNKTGGWRTFKPAIDLEKCISCGMCEQVCPDSAAKMVFNKEGKNKPRINYDYCKGCGLCAAECPVKAIAMELEDK